MCTCILTSLHAYLCVHMLTCMLTPILTYILTCAPTYSHTHMYNTCTHHPRTLTPTHNDHLPCPPWVQVETQTSVEKNVPHESRPTRALFMHSRNQVLSNTCWLQSRHLIPLPPAWTIFTFVRVSSEAPLSPPPHPPPPPNLPGLCTCLPLPRSPIAPCLDPLSTAAVIGNKSVDGGISGAAARAAEAGVPRL
ncbi:hypothetical protein M433DRAFT_168820 [Acidomyces richmondensis BFW]|nr:MAG: hypothetical protein FE78DRAFT_103284 [Acidomyces sp. 'richmondensis']KYG42338.1 hypothetical protein M433DRAFT_168820 [Acidomyces richmondensis BFW]